MRSAEVQQKRRTSGNRRIFLLSFAGELHTKTLMNRVGENSNMKTGKEQCCFKEERGYVDKLCSNKQANKSLLFQSHINRIIYLTLTEQIHRLTSRESFHLLHNLDVKNRRELCK